MLEKLNDPHFWARLAMGAIIVAMVGVGGVVFYSATKEALPHTQVR